MMEKVIEGVYKWKCKVCGKCQGLDKISVVTLKPTSKASHTPAIYVEQRKGKEKL